MQDLYGAWHHMLGISHCFLSIHLYRTCTCNVKAWLLKEVELSLRLHLIQELYSSYWQELLAGLLAGPLLGAGSENFGVALQRCKICIDKSECDIHTRQLQTWRNGSNINTNLISMIMARKGKDSLHIPVLLRRPTVHRISHNRLWMMCNLPPLI